MRPPKLTTDNLNQLAWWRRPGILYFFAAGRPPVAIKIGVTSVGEKKTIAEAIRARFNAIQSSNHETVELLGIVRFTDGEFPTRNAEVAERELHIRFAKQQRFKQHTRAAEWFNVSADLLAHIEAVAERPESLSIPRIIAVAINRAGEALTGASPERCR